MKRHVTLMALAASLGCGGDPVAPVEPSPENAPRVEPTIGFGDPPLEGLLKVEPGADGASDWRYSADVTGDGVEDRAGPVGSGVSVPYRLESPGVHTLTVILDREGEEIALRQRVIVNDPSATQVLGQRVIGSGDDIEGMAYLAHQGVAHLFVGQPNDRRISRLNPVSLETLGESEIPFEVLDAFGFLLSWDETSLYVVTKAADLLTYSVPDLRLDRVVEFRDTGPVYYMTWLSERRLIVGGQSQGIAVWDTDSDEVVRARSIDGGRHFALAPNSSAIGLIEHQADRARLWLLDPGSLLDTAIIDLPRALTWNGAFVAYKPDGSLIYVFGEDGSHFYFYTVGPHPPHEVLETKLDPCEGCMDNISNPLSMSSDGRYILIPTYDGSYVIDTEADLPLYRASQADGWSATAGEGHEFFVGNFEGKLTKLAVNP